MSESFDFVAGASGIFDFDFASSCDVDAGALGAFDGFLLALFSVAAAPAPLLLLARFSAFSALLDGAFEDAFTVSLISRTDGRSDFAFAGDDAAGLPALPLFFDAPGGLVLLDLLDLPALSAPALAAFETDLPEDGARTLALPGVFELRCLDVVGAAFTVALFEGMLVVPETGRGWVDASDAGWLRRPGDDKGILFRFRLRKSSPLHFQTCKFEPF